MIFLSNLTKKKHTYSQFSRGLSKKNVRAHSHKKNYYKKFLFSYCVNGKKKKLLLSLLKKWYVMVMVRWHAPSGRKSRSHQVSQFVKPNVFSFSNHIISNKIKLCINSGIIVVTLLGQPKSSYVKPRPRRQYRFSLKKLMSCVGSS